MIEQVRQEHEADDVGAPRFVRNPFARRLDFHFRICSRRIDLSQSRIPLRNGYHFFLILRLKYEAEEDEDSDDGSCCQNQVVRMEDSHGNRNNAHFFDHEVVSRSDEQRSRTGKTHVPDEERRPAGTAQIAVVDGNAFAFSLDSQVLTNQGGEY